MYSAGAERCKHKQFHCGPTVTVDSKLLNAHKTIQNQTASIIRFSERNKKRKKGK
jgi:hypothetical protein